MSIETLCKELRDKAKDAKIVFLPVSPAQMFWATGSAEQAQSRLERQFLCMIPADHKPTERMVLNVLKKRQSYPWERNHRLSHRRKVLALRAWRNTHPQVMQMSVSRNFGKFIENLAK